jgi:predicted transcriptional regulator
MKTLQINVPDNVMQRLDKLAKDQGGDSYVSVNTSEVNGRDALFTDLLILGLDELAAGEAQFPDQEDV